MVIYTIDYFLQNNFYSIITITIRQYVSKKVIKKYKNIFEFPRISEEEFSKLFIKCQIIHRSKFI